MNCTRMTKFEATFETFRRSKNLKSSRKLLERTKSKENTFIELIEATSSELKTRTQRVQKTFSENLIEDTRKRELQAKSFVLMFVFESLHGISILGLSDCEVTLNVPRFVSTVLLSVEFYWHSQIWNIGLAASSVFIQWKGLNSWPKFQMRTRKSCKKGECKHFVTFFLSKQLNLLSKGWRHHWFIIPNRLSKAFPSLPFLSIIHQLIAKQLKQKRSYLLSCLSHS